MFYLSIAFLLLFLAYIYDFKNAQKFKYQWFYIILIILISVAGFRYRLGLDTIRYMSSYKYVPTISSLTLNSIETHKDPLFFLLSVFSKTISNNFFIFQIIHAIFINSIFFYFIRNNTQNIFTAVFFYFIFSFFNFNYEVLRESLAIAFFLLASQHFIKRQWIKYYFWITLAFFSHSGAVFLFFFPLVRNLKFNKYIFSILPLFFMIGLIIQQNIEYSAFLFSLVSLNNNLLMRYIESGSSLIGQTLGINGIISTVVLYVICPIISVYTIKQKDIKSKYFQPFIIFSIFVALFTISITLFYRIQNYFIFFVIIIFADAFVTMYKQIKVKNIWVKIRIKIISPIWMPFFLLVFFATYPYFKLSNETGTISFSRYYPYNSIFNPKLDKNREYLFFYHKAY